MRAAGIDAFAAPVGQRGRAGAAEQARQPAGQVAADHVAVLRIGRPAPDQLGEDRRAPGERALQRILEVEQAQIILAALADDDPRLRSSASANSRAPFASSWRCSALVKVDTHTVPPRALGPQRRRREIGQRLADPGPGLGEQHVGLALRRRFGREHPRRARPSRAGPRAARPRPVSSASRSRASPDRRSTPSAAAAARRLLPLRQAREQHPLAALGPLSRAPTAAPSPSRAGAASRSRSTRPRARASRDPPASRAAPRRSREQPAPPRRRSPAARSPSARPAPATVGTAKRAGWTKANSSSRSSPDTSG
jgi:hypothetical protein